MRGAGVRAAGALVTVTMAAALQGCGGSGHPAPSNSNPITPTPPPTPTSWTLSGQVVTTIGRQPVAGASIEAGTMSATTESDGRFTLTAPTAPTRAFAAIVRAQGFRTRETTIGYPRTGDPVIDVTAATPPFSEEFYNQLARDALERPEQRSQLWRWMTAPKIYLKTTDETGRAAPPEVITLVTGALADGVRLFSAGSFAASVEQGPDARPEQSGWINVEVKQTISSGDFCGLASSVGGNPSTIQLRLERCGCGSVKIPASVVVHEIGHVLGFFHVADRSSVMYRADSGECRSAFLSSLEQVHVGVAYSRPRGNLDPDRDPVTFSLLTQPMTGAGARGPIP